MRETTGKHSKEKILATDGHR